MTIETPVICHLPYNTYRMPPAVQVCQDMCHIYMTRTIRHWSHATRHTRPSRHLLYATPVAYHPLHVTRCTRPSRHPQYDTHCLPVAARHKQDCQQTSHMTPTVQDNTCFPPRPANSTGLPSRLLVLLTPSTGLLGGRTFLLVLKKLHFWY